MVTYCSCCRAFVKSNSPILMLCHPCYLLFCSLRRPVKLQCLKLGVRKIPLYSLLPYEGMVRGLILRSKAMSCSTSANLLWRILEHMDLETYMNDVVAVYPVESSLKSRIKGKFNLAHFLGSRLGGRFASPLLPWRTKRFFSYRKRSDISSVVRRRNIQDIDLTEDELESTGNPKILIVDDVITTGYTIGSVIQEYPDYEFKILTLATALKKV